MTSNNHFLYSIILISILSGTVINEDQVGRVERGIYEGESMYTVEGIRDEKTGYRFRLYKVTQITPQFTNYPSTIEPYGKPTKFCAICHQDMLTLDRLCRSAIITLKLGEKYDILYADGAPVEQKRAYRLRKGPSKVPIREKSVFACKCPTAPALYLTDGRSPRSITVIMKSPRNRVRRFIQRQRRPYELGI